MKTDHPNKFDVNSFNKPDGMFAPVHAWFWNAELSHEESVRQLDEMQRLGIKKLYVVPMPKHFRPNALPTELEPDYLTKEYFEECLFVVREAKKRSMECWLYDEGGWPSGGACGKVIEKFPETAIKEVVTKDIAFNKGQKYEKSRPETLAAFVGCDDFVEEGRIFEKDTVVKEYILHTESANYPDLTRDDTAEKFFELTHEAYKEAYGDEFEGAYAAIFTDEPSAPGFSYPAYKELEKYYGESMAQYLPFLTYKASPSQTGSEKAHEVLGKYNDFLSKKFCENYLGKCKEWANKHNMKFTGHMNVEHVASGWFEGRHYNIMRALRCMDIPGIDVIWRQIFPGEKRYDESGMIIAENGFFPRYASSAASQTGVRQAMSESLGVYGNGITYDQMRFVFGFQAIRGINVFNPMLISYSKQKYHLAQEQPSFNEKFACQKQLDNFNAYLERLAYICSVGERVCDTALYYPIEDFHRREKLGLFSSEKNFDKLGNELEDRYVDFDIFDSDALENAEGLDEGYLKTGNACYTKLVVGKDFYLTEQAKKALERFKKGGGKVYDSADEVEGVNIPVSAGKVRIMQRTLENGKLYIFFNENDKTVTFDFPVEDKNIYKISTEQAKIFNFPAKNNKVSLTLVSGETAALLMSDEVFEAEKIPCETDKTVELKKFEISKKTKCVLKDTGPETIEFEEKFEKTVLGDWAGKVGEDYSGFCVYKTEFDLEDIPCDYVLSLGKVCYTCKITLNGEMVAEQLMPPYDCVLPKKMLRNHNVLEITVANTMANEYLHTKVLDKYEGWQLSNYYIKAKKFMKDTLPSGLFGPVTLILSKDGQ